MSDLFSKSRITEDEAELLIKASEIVIDANSNVKGWTDQQVKLRKIYEAAVIRTHIAKTRGD